MRFTTKQTKTCIEIFPFQFYGWELGMVHLEVGPEQPSFFWRGTPMAHTPMARTPMDLTSVLLRVARGLDQSLGTQSPNWDVHPHLRNALGY